MQFLIFALAFSKNSRYTSSNKFTTAQVPVKEFAHSGEARLHGCRRCNAALPPAADLSAVLLPYFRARKPDRAVNVAVDVDPVDLL